jgi:hypothetical protein
MDQSVTDFFNANKDVKHNKDLEILPSDLSIEEQFKWVRHKSKCKSLLLGKYDVLALKEEIKSKTILAIPHRNHPKWRSLTLYGYSSVMTNSYEYYKDLGIVEGIDTNWTDVCKFFPKTVEWLKKNNPLKEFSRIRLMILDPNGSSSPHKDYPYGQFLCGPINIAIINPTGSEFVLEDGGIVPWEEGDIRTMDLGSIHCVRNLGNTPRVHIIITPSNNDWDIQAKKIACCQYLKISKC